MSDEREMINFTRESREQLRKAWSIANSSGQEQFEWDGHKFVTKYAEYLLQYLDSKLGPH